MNKLDVILDKFHKSNPADTPTYNLYHDQAKQAIKDLMLEIAKKALARNSATWMDMAVFKKEVSEL